MFQNSIVRSHKLYYLNNSKTITSNIVVKGLYSIWIKTVLIIFVGIVSFIFSLCHLFSFQILIIIRHNFHCLKYYIFIITSNCARKKTIYQYARSNSKKGERQAINTRYWILFVKCCEGYTVPLTFASFICLWPQNWCTQ